MVKIKHLIRGRSQNKIFNTHGKSNSSSPLRAEAGVPVTVCGRGCSMETIREQGSAASSQALLCMLKSITSPYGSL